MPEQKTELMLQIQPETEVTPEELAEMTRDLRRRLLELEVETAEFVRPGAIPTGAKPGDPVTWGTLLVTLVGTSGLLKPLATLVQAWLKRSVDRKVVLVINGDKLEVTGLSSTEQQRLIDVWLKRHQ